jgi:hypothetical protein
MKDLTQTDTSRKENDEYIHQGERTASNQPGKSDYAEWDQSELRSRKGRQMRYPKRIVLRKE